jgi:predicted RND superfamily exporter protein
MIEVSNRAFNDGDVAELRIPESRALVTQYLSLLDPADRAEVVTQDYSKTMIAALAVDRGSASMATLRENLQHEVDEAFRGLDVKASLTGNAVVAWSAMDTVVEEMVVGFVGAFAIVIGIVLIAFRSLRMAIVAVLPNLIPAAACFATIRAAGVALRIDTAIVLCIAMGALFNTTIQLTVRAQDRLKAGIPRSLAINEAIGDVGPPAFFTTAILSAGFSVLAFSSFPGMQALGLLMVVTISFAFISDMLVTPALTSLLIRAPRVDLPLDASLAVREGV